MSNLSKFDVVALDISGKKLYDMGIPCKNIF